MGAVFRVDRRGCTGGVHGDKEGAQACAWVATVDGLGRQGGLDLVVTGPVGARNVEAREVRDDAICEFIRGGFGLGFDDVGDDTTKV